MKIKRNDPCPCGSGKKYKKCCLDKDTLLGQNVYDNAKPFIILRHQQVFAHLEQLLKIADKILDETVNANDIRIGIGAFFTGKAYKTVKAILILCREGYGEDSANLVKGLFDLVVSYLYMINMKTNDRLMRYVEYDWFERASMYKNYGADIPEIEASIRAQSIDPKPHTNSLEEILKEAERVTKKYKFNYSGWSDKSIYQMSKEIGREPAYKSVYKLQSQLSHTSPRAINEYMKEEGQGYVVNVSPSDNWVENNLVATFDFFSHLLIQYDKIIGGKRNKDLELVQSEYIKTVKKTL